MTDTLVSKEAVLALVERLYQNSAFSGHDDGTLAAVAKAVRALHAARTPKGVKPEELNINTRFRFLNSEGKPEGRPCILMYHADDPEKRCFRFEDGQGAVHSFWHGARLIPLNPQEPA